MPKPQFLGPKRIDVPAIFNGDYLFIRMKGNREGTAFLKTAI